MSGLTVGPSDSNVWVFYSAKKVEICHYAVVVKKWTFENENRDIIKHSEAIIIDVHSESFLYLHHVVLSSKLFIVSVAGLQIHGRWLVSSA